MPDSIAVVHVIAPSGFAKLGLPVHFVVRQEQVMSHSTSSLLLAMYAGLCVH